MSLHRATQLHVSLDAFWTQLQTVPPSDSQSDNPGRAPPLKRSQQEENPPELQKGARRPSSQESDAPNRKSPSVEGLGLKARETVSKASRISQPTPWPKTGPFEADKGRVMDTVDRSQRVAMAAARDAAGKARALAEGLEALVRALDALVVELPQAGSVVSGDRPPLAREGELWNVSEVARFLKTSKSWVYQATASGRLPSVRVGHLRRFDPAKIRAWATATTSRSASA